MSDMEMEIDDLLSEVNAGSHGTKQPCYLNCLDCGKSWMAVSTNQGYMPGDMVCPHCGSTNCVAM